MEDEDGEDHVLIVRIINIIIISQVPGGSGHLRYHDNVDDEVDDGDDDDGVDYHDTQVPGGSGHAVHCSLLFHQGEAFSQEVQARANFTSNLKNSFLPEHLFKTSTRVTKL